MLVRFTPVNYAQRANFYNSKTTFKGNAGEEIIKKINSFKNLTGPERVLELNEIAVNAISHPIENSNTHKDIIKTAILYIPESDSNNSDTKYTVEILRLLKYLNSDAEVKNMLITALRDKKLSKALEHSVLGFEPTSYNMYNQRVDIDQALGYCSYNKKPNRHRIYKEMQ